MTRTSPPDSSPSWRGPKLLGCILGGICVVGFCLATRYYQGTKPVHADPLQQPGTAASDQVVPLPAPSQDGDSRPAASSPRFSPQTSYAQVPAYPQTQGYAAAGYRQPVGPALVLGGKVAVAPARAASPVEELKIVAEVNGDPIGREDLARDCLQHFGKDVLGAAGEQVPRDAGVPAARADRQPERSQRRDRADGIEVQAAGTRVAEDAQAGAGRHRGAICGRHHLADPGPAETRRSGVERHRGGDPAGLRFAVRGGGEGPLDRLQ